ncbi:hypothetical protein DOS84_16410 [Flavobacterium aquariorum]|uniref:Carboxypeptidase-like regulatory domain-containing protein n=1 Tax=Flavobacterium aquariorum TaxID=2217670 RepID=A0A2W7U589_9FLAO|nr:hypothetical protein [Flavobacterium aquariorum]PZX92389.1 hypothetical protein DOS84_16410 [Flavobacterium aquariorum]
MKVKLLTALFLIVCQFSFSQTEKLLKGVVTSDNLLLQNVEVINKTSKKSTTTNDRGEFLIQVKVNDSLLFYAKNFNWKRLKVSKEQIELNNLQVVMFKKAEELDEVVVAKKQNLKLSKDKKYEQSKLDEYATEKFDNNEGYQAMRNGTFVNGLNFVTIGKKLLDLFSKEKETEKESSPEIEFAILAKNTCDQKFYLETLKLKSDEIDLFLQFCDTDPKSKALIKNHNILSMMDFLSAKNIEFQELKKL